MTRDPGEILELPSAPQVSEEHRRRGLVFVGLAVGAVGFALAMQMGLNANFVAEELKITPSQQGTFEAIREMWGIGALGMLAILAGFAEPFVGAVMLVLMGLGIASYIFVPDYPWLVMAGLLWSAGFHVWIPLPQSMTLGLAEPGKAGHRLGQIRAASAVGSGAGLVIAYILVQYCNVKIRPLYLLAGAAAILGGAACLGVPRRIKTPGPRLVFRRKYWLFYLLSFLEGWRKQIFTVFAGYLLVRNFKTSLRVMLLLWISSHAIRWVIAPRVGRLIDRVGERRVLVFYFACLTVCFIGYVFIRNKFILYALFVIDGVFFVFAIALTTYVNRIAPPSEHTPTLSMGVAINHIAAVTMPLIGGLLWKYFGYQWAFLIGAAAAALSVLVAMLVPKPEPIAETS